MSLIFATDVDGTILTDQGVPHKKTNDAFRYARLKNHNIVIATGRSLSRTKNLLKLMPDVNFLVCNNGSLIKDILNDKIIYLNFIQIKNYSKIFNFAKENNFSFTMHTNKKSYTWPEIKYQENILLDDKLQMEIEQFIASNPDSDSLQNGEFITQLSILNSETECTKYFPTIQKMFENTQSVFLTNGIFIDVNPLEDSKWVALKYLAKYLKINYENIVTFGDSGNDTEMILKAGKNGFAMKNSTPDLLAILEPKIGDNNSDAIAKKIMELIHNN